MKPTELTTFTDVQDLLVRFWDDGAKYPFKLSRYEYGHHDDFRGHKIVTYRLDCGRISSWNIPRAVGDALYEAWPKDKWGALRGTKTARGIAKTLGIAAEVKKMAEAYEAQKIENRRQAANSSVRYILDKAVAEIGDRATLGDWTHETIVQYLQVALEGTTLA